MNRAELVKTLELIKPALATNNTVPIFECFTFHDQRVSAYNDTIAVVGPTVFDGTCAIHGHTLCGLLSASSVNDISIEFKNDQINLKMGKSISNLAFYPEENFIFREPESEGRYKLPFTQSTADALKLCLETVSSDTTQAALLGVTISGNKFYSCNSDALTRVQLKNTIGNNRALMPTDFCSALLKLWSTLEMTKGVLHFDDDWVQADFGDWQVYGRVLEIQNPIDFEDLIKTTIKTKITPQPVPEALSEALSRARVLADPESKQTHFSIAKGVLKIQTETYIGEVKDDMPFKGHPDVEASVSAALVQQAIGHCDHMAVLENCAVFEAPDVLLLVSNMGG